MCAHSANGHGIGCQAVRTLNIFSDKHTSVREAMQISSPNLSEGCLLQSPINQEFIKWQTYLVMPITSTYTVVNSSCLATNHKVINQL